MRDQIVEKLVARFGAYADLARQLDTEFLSRKIDVPKHKSLAEHLWCVVGSRESYAKAIECGSWAGFNCSMESFDVADFQSKLASSQDLVIQTLRDVAEWDEARLSYLASLSEHEVMHEGQIIRHVYALGRELPESWIWA